MILALCVTAPLVGFFVNALARWNVVKAGIVGCLSAFVSFICAGYLFFDYSQPQTVSFFSWLKIEFLQSSFSFLIDPLSLTMIFMITGVGFLIHLFSVGYMSHDKSPARYFAYLNLFLFNMLVLVLADNLLLMFVGWEGVGLCSYLLIGFWFQDEKKALAGMKAFIANRIGDAGFLIGLFLFFSVFGSLNFLSIDSYVSSSTTLTLTCLFLFIGAMGKSAQIPLYVWLPDAMAGPTPVSALIHAATMVTAGVYMILRTYMMWQASPVALQFVGIIGVMTLLLGAYLACKMWDIKKVLAYSTISQLGYMFLALGVGAFSSSLFHLITHAFFKACLFLSAGSLIHGLNGEQDMRNMGNLKKKMPFSFVSFLIGALALMGLPPTAGFFSKDEILYQTFVQGHYVLWFLALVGAGFTAFYTVKTLYFVFWKKEAKPHQPHEGGWIMNTPLIVLAFFSLFAGVINAPYFLKNFIPYQKLGSWVNFQNVDQAHHLVLELILAGASVLFVGGVACISLYGLTRIKLPKIFQFEWSLDLFYQKYIVENFIRLCRVFLEEIEIQFIQKGILKIGRYFFRLRKAFVSFQSGYLQHYLYFMGFGFLIFIYVILF